MSTIEKSSEVNVPVRTAYNQWTQFEKFPPCMEGVKEVNQLDSTRLHWKAAITGHEKSGMRSSPSRRRTSESRGRVEAALSMEGS